MTYGNNPQAVPFLPPPRTLLLVPYLSPSPSFPASLPLCLLFSLTSGSLTLVIDCYFLVSYEALLMVNGLKNIFGFGFSYAVVPWITLQGFQGAFGTMVG